MATKFNAIKDIRGSFALANMRDTNRTKSYKWQWETIDLLPTNGRFAEKDAAKGFARLCMKIGLRRLETRLVEGGMSAELAALKIKARRDDYRAHFTTEGGSKCLGGRNGVYFAKWGWTKDIIAHEVAHFIDIAEAEITNKKRAGHGPDWLGWFTFLLVDCVGVDFATIHKGQVLRGLRASIK